MNIEKLTDELYLGKLLEEPAIIKGGVLHKMYRVSTSKGLYAVKQLNPEIMKRDTAVSNMICSEKIARAFDGVIPVVAAIEIEGNNFRNWERSII